MDHWENAHNSHQLLAQRLYQEMYDEDGNDDRGSLGLRTVASDFGEAQSWTMVLFYSLQLEWYCFALRVLYVMDTCQLEEL